MNFSSSKEKLIFYYFPVFLFSLIPFFLITGPLLSDLSISLISILFLSYCVLKKNFSFFKKKYFYFFLIFWIYLLINSLINNFNLDSIKISFFYFRYGVFVIAIATLLNFDDKFIKYFFYCTFVCFVSLIFDGFYQYFFGKNILGFETPDSFRVSSFFQDEQILGSYLSRLWPIFFGLSIILFSKSKKIFFNLILIFILSETLIFLSGDRSAFFYINFSAFFVILFSLKLLKLRLITLLCSFALIVFITFFNPSAKERILDKTFSQMNIFNKDKKKDGKIFIFTENHTEMYLSAYKMFLDHKILGVGVKNYRNFCKTPMYKKNTQSCSSHPHNTYIQILSETGIIGFVFLLFILFYFCKHLLSHILLKIKGKYLFNDFEICILSGIAIYLWPIIPTGSIFNNWLNIIMILNIPFLIWSLDKSKKSN